MNSYKDIDTWDDITEDMPLPLVQPWQYVDGRMLRSPEPLLKRHKSRLLLPLAFCLPCIATTLYAVIPESVAHSEFNNVPIFIPSSKPPMEFDLTSHIEASPVKAPPTKLTRKQGRSKPSNECSSSCYNVCDANDYGQWDPWCKCKRRCNAIQVSVEYE